MDLGFWYTTCAVLVPGVLLASWIDYSQRRVPNWLNVALIVAGFTLHATFHGGWGVWTGFLGMLTGLGLLIIPWLMHGMGAGDVKLLAAIGVFFGPWMTLWSFLVGAAIGGVVALVMILSTGRLRMAMANMGIILVKCSSKDTIFSEFGSAKSFGTSSQLLPYGVPLTAGALVVLAARMFGWGGV